MVCTDPNGIEVTVVSAAALQVPGANPTGTGGAVTCVGDDVRGAVF